MLAVAALLVLGAFTGPFGLLWWGVVLYVIVEGVRKYRATQQDGLMWLLTVSAERSMPLTPVYRSLCP